MKEVCHMRGFHGGAVWRSTCMCWTLLGSLGSCTCVCCVHDGHGKLNVQVLDVGPAARVNQNRPGEASALRIKR